MKQILNLCKSFFILQIHTLNKTNTLCAYKSAFQKKKVAQDAFCLYKFIQDNLPIYEVGDITKTSGDFSSNTNALNSPCS